jgi:L-asparaginase
VTVHVLATGGTIASHLAGDAWLEIDGTTLVAELDPARLAELGLDPARDVVVTDITSGPSSNLAVDDMVAIAGRIAAALAAGATGVVVTHGTDTVELTAFVTELLVGVADDRAPVVLTGSMRVHSHPQPDGPTNLLDALTVACAPAARGREVLVCLDGTLHRAVDIAKHDATSLDAFTSHPFAPVGAVGHGRVAFDATPPPARPALRLPAAGTSVDVPLVSCYPGIAASTVAAALEGRRGAVLEVFGDLNVPRQLWRPIHEAATAGTAVVLASRAFTDTTRTSDLDRLGAVGAGGLSAQKARLALLAALGTTDDRDAAIDIVHRYRRPLAPHERSSRHD